jgi:hypothetical protein
MGVVITLVTVPMGLVDGEIHGASIPIGKFLGECSRQRQALGRAHLIGEGHLVFACDAGILAPLRPLGSIPVRIPGIVNTDSTRW